MKVSQFLKLFYFTKKISLRPRTKADMLLTVSRFSKWLGRDATCEDLTELTLSSYLAYMSDEGLQPPTIKSRRGTLITVWRASYRKKYSKENPFRSDVPKPEMFKRKPRAWSIAQMQTMIQQAYFARPRSHTWFSRQYWGALILIIYHSGLRITAVLSLKVKDLNGKILIVPPEIQKDREEMLIELPGHLVEILVNLKRPDLVSNGRLLSEFLIPWPWSLHQPTDQFRKVILEPAGLPANDPKLKFHAIRRTTASIIAAKHGKEAARDALGHSSLKVTELYIVAPEFIDPSMSTAPNPLRSLPHLGKAG